MFPFLLPPVVCSFLYLEFIIMWNSVGHRLWETHPVPCAQPWRVRREQNLWFLSPWGLQVVGDRGQSAREVLAGEPHRAIGGRGLPEEGTMAPRAKRSSSIDGTLVSKGRGEMNEIMPLLSTSASPPGKWGADTSLVACFEDLVTSQM